MQQNMRYKKYNFIDPAEKVYINKCRGYDGIVPHSHEFVELVYISNGKGLHTINGKTFAISAGDLFLLSPDDIHALQPFEDAGEQLCWINCLVLPEFIDFDFGKFPSERKYMGVYGFETGFVFNEMEREFEAKKPEYLKKIRAYLAIILVELTRIVYDPENYSGYQNIRRHILLKNALSFIHDNYRENISLSAVANSLGIGPSYLSRIFREHVGSSVVTYLNRYRLQESCSLLRGSSLPIVEVAIQSGFGDVKFYYTLFKKYYRLTPGKYRNAGAYSPESPETQI